MTRTSETGRVPDMAELVGPYYDTEALVSWLGIGADEVLQKATSGAYISIRTSDEVMLFPVWQFNEDGTVNDDLLRVSKILNDVIINKDGWMTTLWLVTEFPLVGDDGYTEPQYRSAEVLPVYKHLQNGTFVSDIKREANEDARRWTSP